MEVDSIHISSSGAQALPPTGRDSPNSLCIPEHTQHARFVITALFSAAPMLLSHVLLRCEVLAIFLYNMRAKQSPSPPRRYISPKPDKHFPHRTPLCKRTPFRCVYRGERVRNSTKSSVADRTGCVYKGVRNSTKSSVADRNGRCVYKGGGGRFFLIGVLR